MSSRPKSNEVYKKQGLKIKQRKEAKANETPKEQIERARSELKKEVLRGAPSGLRRAFDAFGDGVDVQFLLSYVGMEMVRLQTSLEPGEVPDFRYTSAMTKYMEQLRKLMVMREGSATFIPENISVLLVSGDDDEEEAPDESDRPEFA
tara:strand:+ start:103 stop:546 length:444 start_codon:yes stop_codon:yes gene_type:complete